MTVSLWQYHYQWDPHCATALISRLSRGSTHHVKATDTGDDSITLTVSSSMRSTDTVLQLYSVYYQGDPLTMLKLQIHMMTVSLQQYHYQWDPVCYSCNQCTGGDVAHLVRASDQHAADAGLIPRCGMGFLSQSQLSVQTLLQCPCTPVCNRMHLHLHTP